MACYKPITAFQLADGQVVFRERSGLDYVRQLMLPCGQCVGCRIDRSRQWAIRCMHEAKLSDRNCFVTLTYDDDHLPYRGNLQYKDFQDFMKRLRHRFDSKVRFYMCGEYGEKNWRPHYHACLFGVHFDDQRFWRVSESGSRCYRSALLEQCWTYGNSEVGSLTFASAAYTARYCVQKVTGWNARWHYRRFDQDGEYQLTPEFNKMSLKPGIGARFFDKYHADIYPHDYCVVDGHKAKPPRYYDRRYSKMAPEEFEDIQFRRELRGRALYLDNTAERLAVKEVVAEARFSHLQRSSI